MLTGKTPFEPKVKLNKKNYIHEIFDNIKYKEPRMINSFDSKYKELILIILNKDPS